MSPTTDASSATTDDPAEPAPKVLRPAPSELERLAGLVDVPSEGRDTLTIRSPLTSGVLGTVPKGTRDDVEAAVARSRAAQKSWAETRPKDRAAILGRYQTLVLDHQDELLDLLQAENGKARSSAFQEVADTVLNCQYYGRNASRFLRDKPRRTAVPAS